MDFSRGIRYDRIGTRAFGLMVDERNRLAEDRQAPSSLYDCIAVGTLNMKEAAQLILDQKNANGGADRKYKPKESNNLFQMFACFYRFLMMGITDSPHRIQGYSLRLNGKRGRKDSLENLPRHIEHLSQDFVEDLIGFGHNELKSGARANTTHSKYVLSLGNTDAERQAALDAKVQTRMVYRNKLFKALQLALRDVRTYTYDEAKGVWIAGDRKLKRAKLDASINLSEALEDSINSTEVYDQENLVPASQ